MADPQTNQKEVKMAMLTFIHLFLYPLVTGALLLGLCCAVYNRTRTLLIWGPLFAGALFLTLSTHANYQSYLA